MVRHVMNISDLSKDEIRLILDTAKKMKKEPEKYSGIMKGKTLLMMFEKPSLRTRLSFETGMEKMGGHAIFYNFSDSPIGKKENTSNLLNNYWLS